MIDERYKDYPITFVQWWIVADKTWWYEAPEEFKDQDAARLACACLGEGYRVQALSDGDLSRVEGYKVRRRGL